MKPQIEKLPISGRSFLGDSQTIIEAQLSAKDVDNVKVISACGDAVVTSHESLSGEVLFEGCLNVKVIVCDEDGDLASLNYNVDFNNRFKNKLITPDARLDFASYVVDLSHKVDGNIVYIRGVVETKICASTVYQAEVYTDCEGLNVKYDEVEVCEEKAYIKNTFSLVDEAEVKHRISKILLAESHAVVSSVRCEDAVVTVRGNLYTCVTYQHGDKDVRSVVIDTPFDEEFSANGVDDVCIATAKAYVKNTKLHMEVAEDEENRAFTIEAQIEVCLSVCKNRKIQVVADAFSLTHELKTETKIHEASRTNNYQVHTGKVDGVIEVDGVDEVLCVTNPKVVVVGSHVMDDGVSVEGLLTGCLIYLGEEQVCGNGFEIPFVINTDVTCNGSCEVSNACVTQISAKVVRGAVSIDAGLKFGTNSFDSQKVAVVQNIDLLGERNDDGCAIEVLTGKKGMTAWDMQKYLGMNEADIVACNPDLVLPLQEDRKILVYRKIV